MASVSVLIVDDHPVAREGLKYMLHASPGIEVVAEASTGLGAIERVRAYRPQVVLMDIRMPDMDGLEATRRIKAEFPGVRVVIMTVHDDDQYVAEAVTAGAVGYVLKDAPQEDVLRAIVAAARGDVYIKALLLHRALKSLQLPRKRVGVLFQQREGTEKLSSREMEVLRLLVEGKTNREIGAALFISEDTAKKHVQSIIAKLGATDRTGASVMALRLGLVE